MSRQTLGLRILLLAVLVGAFAGFPGLASAQGADLTEDYRITLGGKLYDNWAKVLGAEPVGTHPAYPSAGKKSGAATFRCKECHGWDYMGVDGAYASGSHFTGIVGVRASAGQDPAQIAAIIRDDTHGFTADMIPDEDLANLALFVSAGQVDMDAVIDRETKMASGDAARGSVYFQTICAGCHGVDGFKPKDMGKTLGAQMSNPWEVMHKIMNGQPDEKMPALRSLDQQVVLDIIAHLGTLPTER